MKKPLADKLAYEFAKSRFESSDYLLDAVTARQVGEFIRVLSKDLQQHSDDFEVHHQDN